MLNSDLKAKVDSSAHGVLADGTEETIDISGFAGCKAILITGYCANINTGFYYAVLPLTSGASVYVPVYNGLTMIHLLKFQVETGQKNMYFSAAKSNNTSLGVFATRIVGLN